MGRCWTWYASIVGRTSPIPRSCEDVWCLSSHAMTTYHCWGARCVGKMPPGKNVDRHPKGAECEMQCQTAALGGHIQACPDGHIARVWYNSCRHRSCPQCAYLQTERWLARQQARLLACDHYH